MTEVIDPNARIADLVGLLYVMNNIFDGKTDLYQLEKEMEVDIDDLMPIVYTASRLGFVSAESGDIIVTEEGKEYIRASIKRRKEIIREALRNIEPFRTALDLRNFDCETLMENLQRKGVQTFNSPSGKHDLEVILIEWGVYSGLLRKDDDGFSVVS
ncbi:TVG0380902 [Thermoplasma volcanium GSS1]|uniref:TVG0380902 protein n=1 Tax=Thermoplasma volcanium (strain ATCC 51530 / DSM 4299 / JCM 9571 / NBRC 15438 / GSS1) TaxID=273116 RepID=Q97BR0_THEVO|nr:AAA-associated domain-containing protein [Thermoplasma volcanium]BAB59537.1 TVG0380902 [Thermoplasma volcanium GSS1]